MDYYIFNSIRSFADIVPFKARISPDQWDRFCSLIGRWYRLRTAIFDVIRPFATVLFPFNMTHAIRCYINVAERAQRCKILFCPAGAVFAERCCSDLFSGRFPIRIITDLRAVFGQLVAR